MTYTLLWIFQWILTSPRERGKKKVSITNRKALVAAIMLKCRHFRCGRWAPTSTIITTTRKSVWKSQNSKKWQSLPRRQWSLIHQVTLAKSHISRVRCLEGNWFFSLLGHSNIHSTRLQVCVCVQVKLKSVDRMQIKADQECPFVGSWCAPSSGQSRPLWVPHALVSIRFPTGTVVRWRSFRLALFLVLLVADCPLTLPTLSTWSSLIKRTLNWSTDRDTH